MRGNKEIINKITCSHRRRRRDVYTHNTRTRLITSRGLSGSAFFLF